MAQFLLTSLYEFEININRNIQKQFEAAEPFLRSFNDYLDPIWILNLYIPLFGVCNHKLLVDLVSSMGMVNALASVIKWCFPEYRPIWWMKEMNAFYKFNDIKTDATSCDTSAGFPSTHTVTFTTFLFIIVWRCNNLFSDRFVFVKCDTFFITHAVALVLSTLLWFGRLYFLYEFLHQCIIGFLLAIGLLHLIERFSAYLLSLSKLKALLVVLVLGSIPITAYFTMLYKDVDPFWSVRMAFKWCADPLYLKHESSPVFILCRDFGNLLGVALSCPLAKSYKSAANNYSKRLPVLFIVELLNTVCRSYTPKQYGRFLFVAYEFLRNCLHSFALLSILPKFDTQ